MEIIDFGKAKAKEITNFHSLKAFYTKITKSEAPITIGFIHIEQGGVVGYHLAPVPQLFIVVEGEGWVEGENQKRVNVRSGEGVLWNKGEGHTSGSDSGLTALVLESEELTL